MTLVAELIMLLGAIVSLIAGIGVLRFSTPFARFHAAGKASPVSFIITALGASLALGWAGAALLLVVSVAMIITLPLGVHLLFRAAHRSGDTSHLSPDDLTRDTHNKS